MFDSLLREIKRLERGVAITIVPPLDEDGYLDRECPAGSCHAEFKVLGQDWREKVSDEQVYCPICRRQAPASEWNTDEQKEYLKALAVARVQDRIHTAVAEDVLRFNRAQRPGLIQLSMSAKRGTRSIIVPVDVAEVMRQKFVCEACGCRYASIGVAFFCPACGHNSVVGTFDQTVETVRKVVSVVPSMRSALVTAHDQDTARDSVRNMLEDSIVRLVGAFERYAGALFNQLPDAASFKRRKNLFQNLGESSALWREAVGKRYEDMLPSAELREMEVFFQQRHLINHRNGIVDQEYIDRSGDRSYDVGQRLVVQESAVLRLAELLSRLAGQLQRSVYDKGGR